MNAAISDPKHRLIEEVMQDLRRMVKALETYSRSVESEFGLTGPQLWALWELGKVESLSLRELAERMFLDPSTVVGVVDRLVARNLVRRDPDPVDRRRVCLTLTEQGRAFRARAPHPAQGQLAHGLTNMDFDRVQELHRHLRELVTVMEADRIEARFFFSEE